MPDQQPQADGLKRSDVLTDELLGPLTYGEKGKSMAAAAIELLIALVKHVQADPSHALYEDLRDIKLSDEGKMTIEDFMHISRKQQVMCSNLLPVAIVDNRRLSIEQIGTIQHLYFELLGALSEAKHKR